MRKHKAKPKREASEGQFVFGLFMPDSQIWPVLLVDGATQDVVVDAAKRQVFISSACKNMRAAIGEACAEAVTQAVTGRAKKRS